MKKSEFFNKLPRIAGLIIFLATYLLILIGFGIPRGYAPIYHLPVWLPERTVDLGNDFVRGPRRFAELNDFRKMNFSRVDLVCSECTAKSYPIDLLQSPSVVYLGKKEGEEVVYYSVFSLNNPILGGELPLEFAPIEFRRAETDLINQKVVVSMSESLDLLIYIVPLGAVIGIVSGYFANKFAANLVERINRRSSTSISV